MLLKYSWSNMLDGWRTAWCKFWEHYGVCITLANYLQSVQVLHCFFNINPSDNGKRVWLLLSATTFTDVKGDGITSRSLLILSPSLELYPVIIYLLELSIAD